MLIGLARTLYIHRTFGDFPAKSTVYKWSWPTRHTKLHAWMVNSLQQFAWTQQAAVCESVGALAARVSRSNRQNLCVYFYGCTQWSTFLMTIIVLDTLACSASRNRHSIVTNHCTPPALQPAALDQYQHWHQGSYSSTQLVCFSCLLCNHSSVYICVCVPTF